jgi:hypothetical protein
VRGELPRKVAVLEAQWSGVEGFLGVINAIDASEALEPQIQWRLFGRTAMPCACTRRNCNKSKLQKPIDCMDVVFFVLSFSAVVVLFGSVIASLAWLILWTLRLVVRLLAKL